MKANLGSRQSGFTLIEVMVALVIVGIALPAMLMRMQGVLTNTADISTRTYAYWLAENKRQELMITQTLKGDVVKTKKKQDSEEFAGQEWFWKMEIEPSEQVNTVYKYDISVGLDVEDHIVTLTGYIHE